MQVIQQENLKANLKLPVDYAEYTSQYLVPEAA